MSGAGHLRDAAVSFSGIARGDRGRRAWFSAPANGDGACAETVYAVSIPCERDGQSRSWAAALAQAIAERLVLDWRSPIHAHAATGILDVPFVRIVELRGGSFFAIVSAAGSPTATAVQIVHDAGLRARAPGKRYVGCAFDTVTATAHPCGGGEPRA